MFDYDVLSEEKAMQEKFQLLPEGEYEAVIDKSEDKISSSGNPMMDMHLSVYDSEGRTHSVRDFLVFTKGMMWKVIHCADSAGILSEYESKKFCSATIHGRNVKVRVVTEKGSLIPDEKLNGKAHGSRYPDKNKIEDYISNTGNISQNVVKDNSFDDDQIPF